MEIVRTHACEFGPASSLSSFEVHQETRVKEISRSSGRQARSSYCVASMCVVAYLVLSESYGHLRVR